MHLEAANLYPDKLPHGEHFCGARTPVALWFVRTLHNRLACSVCSGGSSLPDRLEDDTASHLWQWEVRDCKLLPKEQRPAAVAIKRRGTRVSEAITWLPYIKWSVSSPLCGLPHTCV